MCVQGNLGKRRYCPSSRSAIALGGATCQRGRRGSCPQEDVCLPCHILPSTFRFLAALRQTPFVLFQSRWRGGSAQSVREPTHKRARAPAEPAAAAGRPLVLCRSG